MSSIFKASTPKVIPEFTGLQVNTAVQVLPVPIIYGSPRISINLIYYNDFVAKVVSTSSGGKGILSSGKGGSQEVEYFATIILALGEGPLGSILVIYQDQGVYTTADYPSPGLNYFVGTDTQLPWSYLVGKHPLDARSYKDTAYVAVANAQLDSSATVPQINMVVEGLFRGTCPLNNTTITITTGQYDQNGKPISFLGNISLGDADADPATVIYDILTNTRYGAGFPAEFIDAAPGASLFSGPEAIIPTSGDSALQTYAQAVGFGYSLVLNNVESANSILERLTRNMSVAPVWTGELLKFIPHWDTPSAANPGYDSANPLGIPRKYFSPNITPYVSLTVDHILQSDQKEGDPIVYSRTDPMLTYNTVRVDYRDRTNFFNDNVVEAKDEAQAELFGPHVDNVGLANEFTLAAYANAAAQLRLRRSISIRRNFEFKLGPLWAFLDPMDLVDIPDPADWTKTLTVRIISCEDDENEITTYKAEEWTGGSLSPALIPVSQTTPPNQGPTNVPPSSVFPPVIFEPTNAMLTAQGISTSTPQVVVGASGGINDIRDPNWGGCIVNVSLDDASYERIGTITGPSAVGRLASDLVAFTGTNPDNVSLLEVDMNESGVALPSFSDAVASAGKSLCVVMGGGTFELFSYTTSTLVVGNTFHLTGLYRGIYGTTSRAFGNGALFLFMGINSFLEMALPAQYIGQTFWIKLQSFNTFGTSTQTLDQCVAYQYIPTGPVSPAGTNAAIYSAPTSQSSPSGSSSSNSTPFAQPLLTSSRRKNALVLPPRLRRRL